MMPCAATSPKGAAKAGAVQTLRATSTSVGSTPSSDYLHGWMSDLCIQRGQAHLVIRRQFRQIEIGDFMAPGGKRFQRGQIGGNKLDFAFAQKSGQQFSRGGHVGVQRLGMG